VSLAHDMFVKPTPFFAPADGEVHVRLLNGTFTWSEKAIARHRIADASMLTPVGRMPLDTAEWDVDGDASAFPVHTQDDGTYVIGVSLKPNQIELAADDFNRYLEVDGIPDVLAARKAAGELGKPARERYHKHVKAMLQVGQGRSNHYATAFGYPAEIIPLTNPYDAKVGQSLRLELLVDGRPAANQVVQFGGQEPSGAAIAQTEGRSDAQGVIEVPLTKAGIWYVKFIHMESVKEPEVDYESKWSSLTFEVR